MYRVILKLVTGENVYYDYCDEWTQVDTILMKIKGLPFVTVIDSKDKIFTVYTDKVVGCYMEKNRIFQQEDK